MYTTNCSLTLLAISATYDVFLTIFDCCGFSCKMRHLRGRLDLLWLLVQTANSILPLSSANDCRTDQLSSATYNRHEIFINGTFIFAGLFPIHYAPQNNSSSQLCRGKFNIRGFEEALAMVYALQQINKSLKILPGITIEADIEDTCSTVDFAIRKCLNFSFVKRNMENGMCERVKSVESSDPKTVAIIGVGSSDVAMAVTNFAGLFYVPVVGYSSSSRLLSNRNRFKYFLRTISSDSLMARAVVDLLHMLKWNFVHVLYSDTDYGRSAVETFEHVLGSSWGANICFAVKRTFTKHTDDVQIKRILDDIKAKKNTKAKGVLLFTTTEDTEILLSHFDTSQMKDYVFISTDYFTGSVNRFQSSREMLKRVIGVTPHHRRVDSFLKYLQSVNESFVSCPWKEEYNKQRLKDPLEHSIYAPYVVDAVYAAAYGLHSLLNCTPGQGCQHSPDEFPILNRWEKKNNRNIGLRINFTGNI